MSVEFFDKAFVWVIVLGLAACVFVLGRRVRRALASRAWPTVPGEIVAIDMHVQHTVREPLYVPTARYRYRVAGESFEGNALSDRTQRKFFTQSAANAVLLAYPLDSRVVVYYDPLRPHDSTLAPGVSGLTWVVIGLLSALVALVGLTAL